jgi:D-serine deaminase-like pyridoxal phosphate-dependent protein
MSEHPPTPHIEIDEQRIERNLARAAEYVRHHGLNLRPHAKTHKSIALAQRQLSLGSIGLTIAKVGEAEVMAGIGDDIDLLLAYPVVDPDLADRLVQLSDSAVIRVAIDSTLACDTLNAAAQRTGSHLGILVDLDIGMHRTGLPSPEAALKLAQYVDQHSKLRLDGLFCYPGQIIAPINDQGAELDTIAALLEETLELWRKAGLCVSVVSGGSTPTLYQSHLLQQLTEIRPGTYIFNDVNTAAGGYCGWDDCAAVVVCTVVSEAVQGQVVVDAGSKTLTSDRLIPPGAGHGNVQGYPLARVTELSEEHGQIDIRQCETRPVLGERVRIIPNHICPCINLQDQVWLKNSDGSLRPLIIEARGKV